MCVPSPRSVSTAGRSRRSSTPCARPASRSCSTSVSAAACGGPSTRGRTRNGCRRPSPRRGSVTGTTPSSRRRRSSGSSSTARTTASASASARDRSWRPSTAPLPPGDPGPGRPRPDRRGTAARCGLGAALRRARSRGLPPLADRRAPGRRVRPAGAPPAPVNEEGLPRGRPSRRAICVVDQPPGCVTLFTFNV